MALFGGALERFGGVGPLVGVTLLFAAGAVLVSSRAQPFLEATKRDATARPCGVLLESPRKHRWVTVSGCAVAVDAQGLAALSSPQGTKATVLVWPATTDAGAPITGLVVELSDARVDERVRAAAPAEALVLLVGVEPERPRALFAVLLGVALMTAALMPLVRRFFLERLSGG